MGWSWYTGPALDARSTAKAADAARARKQAAHTASAREHNAMIKANKADRIARKKAANKAKAAKVAKAKGKKSGWF